jgi:small conductance mechanosensitive channel
VAIIWGLAILGVNVGTIFAGVGILALVLGFGAESLVSDLVTGAFILFENQYNVGDIVELDGYRGTVDFVGIRTTGIRDVGGNVKIINNSDIKNIINRSERSSVAVTTVGIHYAMNIEEVEKKIPDILNKIKERNRDVFIGEVNYLGVEELADSSVTLKFTAEVEEKNIFTGRRLLNREIKALFDDAGIEIAFPQMDVHMK